MTVRALVVDDSPTVRAALRRLLIEDHRIEVVGEAGDGLAAIEAVQACAPDVVVMDVQMPLMDGVEASRTILRRDPAMPIVVVTSAADGRQVTSAFSALSSGVAAVFPKPETPQLWYELGASLRTTIVELAASRHVPDEQPTSTSGTSELRVRRQISVVAIGASTGGPSALRRLLLALGPCPEVAVVIVQHIARGFEVGLSRWLASETDLSVAVATDREALSTGAIRIAPPDCHLEVDAGLLVRLDRTEPPVRGHRPSIDRLFYSLLDHEPRSVGAVLLSGMGDDGVEAMAALRAAGSLTIVQDAASCAVHGMPRAAVARGAATIALPPDAIGRLVARSARSRRR